MVFWGLGNEIELAGGRAASPLARAPLRSKVLLMFSSFGCIADIVGHNDPSARPICAYPVRNDEFFALDHELQGHPLELDRVVTA